MTLYDIQGNEIHGKEVVFEYTLHVGGNPINSLLRPSLANTNEYCKLVFIGPAFWTTYHYFAVYRGMDSISCSIYLGQLKDSI